MILYIKILQISYGLIVDKKKSYGLINKNK